MAEHMFPNKFHWETPNELLAEKDKIGLTLLIVEVGNPGTWNFVLTILTCFVSGDVGVHPFSLYIIRLLSRSGGGRVALSHDGGGSKSLP